MFEDQKELKDAMWKTEMMRRKDTNQVNQGRVNIMQPSTQISNQIMNKVLRMRLPGMNISNRVASPSS